MEDRLRKFASLADAGSFSKAAAELHISQPALSTAIAKLERELKVKLLVRGVRPLALTPAGRLAYRAAKDLSVHLDNLKLGLAELSHQPVTLKIGMIDSLADSLFADSSGLELIKDAKISLVVNNSRYLVGAVERGEVDLAFIARQQGQLPALLESSRVADEPLIVVAKSNKEALRDKKVLDLVAYDQPSNTFRLVNEALKSYGLTPKVNFYSTSPELILRLVLLGQGAAALPYLLVRDYLKNGSLQRIGSKTPLLIKREIIAVKRRDKELPMALKRLTGQAVELLDSLMVEAL